MSISVEPELMQAAPTAHVAYACHLAEIPRGAKPGDIRVEPPTKFEFDVKRTTAKALGLDVSRCRLPVQTG